MREGSRTALPAGGDAARGLFCFSFFAEGLLHRQSAWECVLPSSAWRILLLDVNPESGGLIRGAKQSFAVTHSQAELGNDRGETTGAAKAL